MGCQNLAELISNVKRSNREKRFCAKVFKLVHDVDGRRIESYKECWRWLRSVIQDFVQLKKVSGEQQKILTKIDHYFNQTSSLQFSRPQFQTLQSSTMLQHNPT